VKGGVWCISLYSNICPQINGHFIFHLFPCNKWSLNGLIEPEQWFVEITVHVKFCSWTKMKLHFFLSVNQNKAFIWPHVKKYLYIVINGNTKCVPKNYSFLFWLSLMTRPTNVYYIFYTTPEQWFVEITVHVKFCSWTKMKLHFFLCDIYLWLSGMLIAFHLH
jgi:hypothetical protein